MNKIKCFYPNFKSKCFTMSYDDGVIQDVRFISYLNEYGIKATFNLNSGLFSLLKFRDGVDNSRLSLNDVKKLYNGHEIASHSLYHFHLERLNYEENFTQIEKDINNLKEIFNQNIFGFVYPYGTYSNDTIDVLKKLNVLYARTTKPSYSFKVSDDLLLLSPTCSHSDNKLMQLALKFLQDKNELSLFYVWGHTYEFENNSSWNILEDLLKLISNKEDIAYLTNYQALSYVKAYRNLIIKEDIIINSSDIDLYLEINNKKIIIKRNTEYKIGE